MSERKFETFFRKKGYIQKTKTVKLEISIEDFAKVMMMCNYRKEETLVSYESTYNRLLDLWNKTVEQYRKTKPEKIEYFKMVSKEPTERRCR